MLLAEDASKIPGNKELSVRDIIRKAKAVGVELPAGHTLSTEARDAVTAWMESHPWQQRVNRLLSIERKPFELVALERAVTSCNTELAFFERGATDSAQRVAALNARIATVEADQVQTQHSLMGAV